MNDCKIINGLIGGTEKDGTKHPFEYLTLFAVNGRSIISIHKHTNADNEVS